VRSTTARSHASSSFASAVVRVIARMIANNTFVDYQVTRLGIFTAKTRRRDQGNLIGNPGFEVDATGWNVRNGATIARTTQYKFRGSGASLIVKPVGEAFAHVCVSKSVVATRPGMVGLIVSAINTGAFGGRGDLGDYRRPSALGECCRPIGISCRRRRPGRSRRASFSVHRRTDTLWPRTCDSPPERSRAADVPEISEAPRLWGAA
jgi:hypothetical protein